MSGMNRTLLLSLISRCQQLLLTDMMAGGARDNQTTAAANDGGSATSGGPANTTATAAAAAAAASASFDQRKSYDNAYFYILFVMLFYFVLVGTLFKNSLRGGDARDPYAEFMGSAPASTAGPGKFNPGLASERFDFEEENSLC